MNKSVVKIDDGEIKYCSFGKGIENLVIIPGIYLKSVVDEAEILESTFSYLTNKYTVYLFDRKTILKDNETIEDMADDLIKALSKLNINNCDVYATSQGAIIAQYIAIKTNIINKMLLASSVIRIDDYTENLFIELIKVIKTNNIEDIVDKFISNVYSKKTLEQYKNHLIEVNRNLTVNDIHNLEVMCKAMNTTVNNKSKLKDKKIKTFVVGSRSDNIFRTRAIEELIEDVDAVGYFYEGFSHGVYDEAQSFHELMRSFFLDNRNFS